ncbi:hypothetical protein GTA08_BOTSDO01445 [Botryosphaeria dothidea]|uniref:Uncharacterized protein n=1 Tax=Botryosphaeria dothidea TaxID=55169 RepID=A0A8H4J5M9_9PEZI|nr:hypothetical protein GTA08_BOTSDO01445 [Botryosphaeria dothidea]
MSFGDEHPRRPGDREPRTYTNDHRTLMIEEDEHASSGTVAVAGPSPRRGPPLMTEQPHFRLSDTITHASDNESDIMSLNQPPQDQPAEDPMIPQSSPEIASSELDEEEARDEQLEDMVEAVPETQLLPLFDPDASQPDESLPIGERAKSFRDKLKKGFHFLAEFQWDLDHDNVPAMRRFDKIEWMRWTVPVLAATPTPILTEIMGGNLAKAKIHDQNVAKILKTSEERLRLKTGQNAPAIYHLLLVDDEGNSPTANELSKVVDTIERYEMLAHSTLADEIDSVMGQQYDMAKSTDGYRKYIPGSQQLEEVRIFCNALSKRIGEISKEDRDLPLHAPLRYFGYGDVKHRGCNLLEIELI